MISYQDIWGIELIPTPPNRPHEIDLGVIEGPLITGAAASQLDLLWMLEKETNPELFDGPILVIRVDDLREGDLLVRRWSYKRHFCLQNTLFRSLGVQGLVIGRDHAGTEHLLLGRRSSSVRMYPGLWENAPSGGVPPPPTGVDELHRDHILKALMSEGLEEIGLSLHPQYAQFIATLEDQTARSFDLVFRLELGVAINSTGLPCAIHEDGRWEYADAAWVPMTNLRNWVEQNAHAVSPPTRALTRWLTEPPQVPHSP